jgi:hypothetical protein|nr:MAG: hypothetical protein DIU60_23685 [Actinomycetota bacterium]
MSQQDAGGTGALGAEQVEQPPAPDIDISKPHVARMYDYFLGGKNNYAADRQAAEAALKATPEVRLAARANRRFLIKSVRWLAQEAGIRQFLDIGSGLPTQQNVHEVAQSVDPNARVVYIDNDPLVRVHADVLLATDPNTIVLEADMRDPKALLDRPEIREHLDFSQPIALLLVAVLHFIRNHDEAYAIADTLREALPPGSYVVLSHVMLPEQLTEGQKETLATYNTRTATGLTLRTRDQIARFFQGLTPVGSGLSLIADWTIGNEHDSYGDDVISIDEIPALKGFPLMCGVARVDG